MKVRAKRYNYEDKVPIKFSRASFDMLIAYALKSSKYIKIGNLFSLNKLVDKMDERIYQKDILSLVRFNILKKILYARLKNHITNKIILIDYARTKKYEDIENEIFDIISEIDLSKHDISYLTGKINEKISYIYLYEYKPKILEIFSKIDDGDYETFGEIMKYLESTISKFLVSIRRSRSVQESEKTFSLVEDIFKSAVTHAYNEMTSAASTLKTTIQKFNEMLDGGITAKKVYTILGISGGFKSGTLINIVDMIRKGNPYYEPKDPDKIPTVLYVTLENTNEETISRLYSLSADDTNDRMKYCSNVDECISNFVNKGNMKLTQKYNINIISKSLKSNNTTANDIDLLINEVEEEGYEVICCVVDYIKKMRSERKASDLRLELGFIIDELKEVAKERNISIVTATQLNRETNKIIEEAMKSGKMDLARYLGNSGVGESWAVIENSDWSGIVYRERLLSTNEVFLTFKRTKLRDGSDDSINYFNHPFKKNEFGLEPDLDLPKPLSKKYLSQNLVEVEGDIDNKFGMKGPTSLMERRDITKPLDEFNFVSG